MKAPTQSRDVEQALNFLASGDPNLRLLLRGGAHVVMLNSSSRKRQARSLDGRMRAKLADRVLAIEFGTLTRVGEEAHFASVAPPPGEEVAMVLVLQTREQALEEARKQRGLTEHETQTLAVAATPITCMRFGADLVISSVGAQTKGAALS